MTVKQKDTYTGLRDVNGTLTYFTNGQADKTYTGFVSYAGNNYYVINGVVDTSYTNVTSVSYTHLWRLWQQQCQRLLVRDFILKTD